MAERTAQIIWYANLTNEPAQWRKGTVGEQYIKKYPNTKVTAIKLCSVVQRSNLVEDKVAQQSRGNLQDFLGYYNMNIRGSRMLIQLTCNGKGTSENYVILKINKTFDDKHEIKLKIEENWLTLTSPILLSELSQKLETRVVNMYGGGGGNWDEYNGPVPRESKCLISDICEFMLEVELQRVF